MHNREGFGGLFHAEYPGLVRELRLVLLDRTMAEDVAMDAFVEAWRKWSTVEDLDRPGAWVRKVALRRAHRTRSRQRRRPMIEATFTPTQAELPVDLDLQRALADLSTPQRVAVVMHHVGGWPASDIAEVLGCAEPTVRSHLLRGRQRLAVLLDDSAPEEV